MPVGNRSAIGQTRAEPERVTGSIATEATNIKDAECRANRPVIRRPGQAGGLLPFMSRLLCWLSYPQRKVQILLIS